MLPRPVADLVLATIGSAVAVGAVAVVVLQEVLVLALQIVLEDDAADLEIPVLISETVFLLPVR